MARLYARSACHLGGLGFLIWLGEMAVFKVLPEKSACFNAAVNLEGPIGLAGRESAEARRE